MNSLNIFEVNFEKLLQTLHDEAKLQKAGSLLPIIPTRDTWEDFLSTIKSEWHSWQHKLIKYPKCLVVLYGGLAFYEYDENTFWPQFYKAVGSEQLPTNRQTEINSTFSKAAEQLGLKMRQRRKGSDYVGSAVYHIGIPLSLWDGFIEICEWVRVRAQLQEKWETLTDDEWAESIGKRAGGRQRLKKFLVDNREAATSFIKEILDARQILSSNPDYTISDLKQACFLRPEYFDEVPETAEFLRPENPESLFQDRARLICDLQRYCISVQLPAVKKDKLPATWSIGTCTQKAATTPDELVLNSQAFNSALPLKLKSETKEEIQRLRGISPWGIIDLEKGEFVNPNRQQLPLRSYAIIAPAKLEVLRKGFDEEENLMNEPFELKDGTTCFVTRLWPSGNYAELLIKHNSYESRITFRTRSKIEARFYVGRANRAANFAYSDGDSIKTDTLPTLCVALPCGYFNNVETALSKFQVLMDDKPAGGSWKKQEVHDSDDREYYIWEGWKFIEKKKSGVQVLKDLKNIGDCYKSSDIRGKHIFSIRSPEFKKDYKLYIDHYKSEIHDCWANLPGAFLLWFLLCQPTQGNKGMKWDDLLLAKDIIAPNEPISWKLLGKYYKKGFFEKRGHYWVIAESRAAFKNTNGNSILQYCGDPLILWGLYHRMCKYRETLPLIEVIEKRREVPYLEMTWARYRKGEVEQFLKKKGVLIGETLWTH